MLRVQRQRRLSILVSDTVFLMTTNGKKVALITGVTGQDGSYLAEFLLAKGYQVNGIIRRSSSFNTARIDHLYQDPHEKEYRFRLWYGDLCDGTSILRILEKTQPDEIYNLGAQSHVRVSFDLPAYTAEADALGTLRLLEQVRTLGLSSKIYHASSSEMFGSTPSPQHEGSPFHPRSPYGAAKVFSHHIAVNYRESYGMFVCSGILFNHESPRRGETFVTRKITHALARILSRKQEALYLGNLDARRDWGYAAEYVEAMWAMLQQETPNDYVIGTGETHSVREFLDTAFGLVGLAADAYVKIDARYFRPAEVEDLRADASRAAKDFSWTPRVRFTDLVTLMVIDDMRSVGLDPTAYGLPVRHPLTASYLQDRA